jgi:prepilin-type N-terminal cleavage/methylation domain-containing protein
MPKTWAYCRRKRVSARVSSCVRSRANSHAERHATQRGFTLLELLVVLALVALVAGLVAPVASNAMVAARERAVLAELNALLEGLPVRSFRAGTAQSYSGEALRQLLPDMPAGWSVDLVAPLRYSDSGVASGGVVRLLAPGRPAQTLRVLPVSGEVQSAAGPT